MSARLAPILVVSLVLSGRLAAETPDPSVDEIKAAVARAIPLLEKGARGSMEQRQQCFTCHNQGLPILALTTARGRGFAIDEEHLKQQVAFIARFLDRNRGNYLKGRGTGGQADTAGYALLALEAGGHPPDPATAAVAEYLLQYQKELDHYRTIARRPPSEQSSFTTTYVALRGLRHYGTPEQKERIERRIEQVRGWLVKARVVDTEDRVFRLWGLKTAGAEEQDLQAAVADLLKLQRDDGGWAQLDDLDPDPYATGTALVALHQAGGLPTRDPAYRKGLAFLLTKQLGDGSWYVRSRSRPFQIYFESGFPHGKDQFISITASGWATTALALACPKP